jgi:hypothetical protein
LHFGHEGEQPLFVTGQSLPEGAAAVLNIKENGACVFFEPGRGNLCAVHRELGVAALPVACRQFPRVVLQDRRGTFISLSHYCPTAAALLRSPPTSAFEVVEAPGNLALDGGVEGLDARDALPPLLGPEMLTDLDGYNAWERRALGLLARHELSAERALAILTAATHAIQTWVPGGASLRDTVEREFDVASARKPNEDLGAPGDYYESDRRVRLALSSVPASVPRPSPVSGCDAGWRDVLRFWSEYDGTVRGYLAARLFGNWVSYYGQGLHAVVEYLQVALAVVKMEAVRHLAREQSSSPWQTVIEALRSADLLLVHLSDPRALANRLS